VKLIITGDTVLLEDFPEVDRSVPAQDRTEVAFLLALSWGAARMIEVCKHIDTERKERAAAQSMLAQAHAALTQAMH
jgi:hypothetical protein